MTEKQRKALAMDLLFKKDICLICLSQIKHNYSNHFEMSWRILWHLDIQRCLCIFAKFHNFRTLPRIKHPPWLESAFSGSPTAYVWLCSVIWNFFSDETKVVWHLITGADTRPGIHFSFSEWVWEPLFSGPWFPTKYCNNQLKGSEENCWKKITKFFKFLIWSSIVDIKHFPTDVCQGHVQRNPLLFSEMTENWTTQLIDYIHCKSFL